MYRKLTLLFAGVLFSALSVLAGPYTHFTYLNGAQENPPTGSVGSGIGRFELIGNDLHYVLWYSGLTGNLTNGHIHTGGVGVNGGVLHPLQNLTATGANGVWAGLTPAQIASLNAHGLYVNIHTDVNPGGDIRGQILTRGTRVALLSGQQEVPPNPATGVGFGWFDLNSTETALDYAIKWSGLTGDVTAAHIHAAPAGTNGGVVHGLLNLSNTGAFGSWALAAGNVTQFHTDLLYVNAHTSTYPGGEIRGQIVEICIPEDANFDAVTDVGVSMCIALCPDRSSRIRVFNLAPGQYPVVTKRLGCSNPCDVDCDPSTYIQEFFGGEWQITNGVFWLEIRGDGCICVTLDFILPVELNDFSAIAGDNQVQLQWSTASESNLDRFEVQRDGSLLQSSAAHNSSTGASYSWTDETAQNGVTYSYTLVAVNLDGTREVLATASATPRSGGSVVSEFALYQNYPNPFNPETSIRFDLMESANVTLSIYNIAGQEVATLVNGTLSAGSHTVNFDGGNLTSGVYLYRLTAGSFTAQKKMVLLK
ncbi:CHRD domain-containing protein [bacterium]|nr:CHRD domain-containing protein [bacterium]